MQLAQLAPEMSQAIRETKVMKGIESSMADALGIREGPGEEMKASGGGVLATAGLDGDALEMAEREALVELYNRLGGKDWVRSSGWLSDAPISTWHGVHCADHHGHPGHVVAIDLAENKLRGDLWDEMLLGCERLEKIDLSFNDVGGTIPAETLLLTELQIFNLEGTAVEGPVPPTLYDMTGEISATAVTVPFQVFVRPEHDAQFSAERRKIAISYDPKKHSWNVLDKGEQRGSVSQQGRPHTSRICPSSCSAMLSTTHEGRGEGRSERTTLTPLLWALCLIYLFCATRHLTPATRTPIAART